MTMLKDGTLVRVHYTGTLDDGSQFDSSVGQEPLEFEIGGNKVIQGFEDAIRSMQVGETQKIRIISEEAYGPVFEDLIIEVDKKNLPGDLTPEVGMTLQMQSPQGEIMYVNITEVRESNIVLDANHPLAGKALNFEIQLLSLS